MIIRESGLSCRHLHGSMGTIRGRHGLLSNGSEQCVAVSLGEPLCQEHVLEQLPILDHGLAW